MSESDSSDSSSSKCSLEQNFNHMSNLDTNDDQAIIDFTRMYNTLSDRHKKILVNYLSEEFSDSLNQENEPLRFNDKISVIYDRFV